jgi:hypothetical protein
VSMFTPPGVGGRKPVRRGARRSRPGVLLLAVVVTAALVAGGWWWQSRPTEDVSVTQPAVHCPTPRPTPTLVAAAAVKVNVYNATEQRGLASRVAAQLRKRGFTVRKIANDPLDRTVTGAAEVRSSALGAGAAHTVTAQVAPAGQVGAAPAVTAVPDQRNDATVDLVLGAGWHGLRPPADAAAALSPTPQPVPSGC